ncbi:MAG: efflux RND transporter permease subunit [Flavobacteriaceae bacterium]|nr:efflux RND transporter permease subunit [Flavobacteriaceae bacterium]
MDKEFKPSSWAINNKTTIYVAMIVILFMGFSAFLNMPRESFPEVKETKIYVSTVFPGNTAEDIEKLITDPLEEKLKIVSNVTKIISNSLEDYSMIMITFDENIEVATALQKVKDKIEQETSSQDWPTFNGAKVEPNAFDLTLSEEFPIENINISGDYPRQKLKEYAEYLKEEIESLSEIKEAAIRGAEKKEVEIAVDVHKMVASKVNFRDITNAISRGNMTMSAGNMIANGQRRTIRILGEIEKPKELEKFIVKNERGNAVYLKDIATVSFQEKDKTTYARMLGKPVIMLDIKKRSGENMVAAAHKIEKIVAKAKATVFPQDVKIQITNDQSAKTIGQVDDLVNNIIFGVILVVGVLMFFLGFKNSAFVGFAIPMSMLMSLMILNAMGYTINTMILFGLIMGLGMLVDNGIVVVENVYRLMDEEGMSRMEAAKKGIGEIAFPIIISTATTVAAFVPLGMWPGTMGQFMKYFPITLSVVLGSSLFVAVFFNSVLVSEFMTVTDRTPKMKKVIILSSIMVVLGVLLLIFGTTYKGLGGVLLFSAVMIWLDKLFLRKWAHIFQNKALPFLENLYEKSLRFSLSGKMPVIITVVTFVVLMVTFIGFGSSIKNHRTKVEFFPDNTPNQIIVYVEYPEGTDIEKTNAIMKDIEKRVYSVINSSKYTDGNYNFLVESAVAQVGAGAGNPMTDGGSSAEMPHRGKITATMREFKFRRGANSRELMKEVTEVLKGVYPGIKISVEKNQNGPPSGYPINIELQGKDYAELIETAEKIRDFLNEKKIAGIDELKVNVNKSKPNMLVQIDREKASKLGVSVAQIGSQLRNSIFGTKAGVYKEKGEDYDINVRFEKDQRYSRNIVFNQRLTFKNNRGETIEIPISALIKETNSSGFSTIKHKNTERVVTVYSELAPGYTDASAVVAKIQHQMKSFTEQPKGIKIDYTGKIEEQKKQMNFLMGAFLAGLGLIFFLLIFQFNSVSKPIIIMLAIFLSLIGVFGGLVITGSPFVIMMTMMGIISLAGIVVNNGVVLLDYTQLLIDRKKAKEQLSAEENIDTNSLKEILIVGGKARLRPVLLTAITTILGLVPLAIGLNINFFTLFSEFNPHIYVGGDNVTFWGPLAWSVIYGLVVATFLTLIVVPILFFLSIQVKLWFQRVVRF